MAGNGVVADLQDDSKGRLRSTVILVALADSDPPNKPKRNKLAFACAFLVSLTTIILGYDMGVMSGAIMFIKKDFDITDVEIQVLVGIINFYSIIGSLLAGKTSDWIGRRYTIMLADAIFFAAALLMAFATNYAFLMVGRFVAGIGVGYALTIAPVYIAEVSPPASRGYLTSFPEGIPGYRLSNGPPRPNQGTSEGSPEEPNERRGSSSTNAGVFQTRVHPPPRFYPQPRIQQNSERVQQSQPRGWVPIEERTNSRGWPRITDYQSAAAQEYAELIYDNLSFPISGEESDMLSRRAQEVIRGAADQALISLRALHECMGIQTGYCQANATNDNHWGDWLENVRRDEEDCQRIIERAERLQLSIYRTHV